MTSDSSSGAIRSVLAAIRATPVLLRHIQDNAHAEARPFVTISRQGGAGGHTVGQLLVDRLNQLDPGETPWTLWDREIVEKVVTDHNVQPDLVEALGESARSWMEDFLAGLSFETDQTEARIYQYVATTMRALAIQGRVVLVGRGGVYITRHLPRGVHLRLIAPLEYRVQAAARQFNLSTDAATSRVHQLDRQRDAFYRRYWPREVVAHETFSVTINTALVTEHRAVECALPLILPSVQVKSQTVKDPELATL